MRAEVSDEVTSLDSPTACTAAPTESSWRCLHSDSGVIGMEGEAAAAGTCIMCADIPRWYWLSRRVRVRGAVSVAAGGTGFCARYS